MTLRPNDTAPVGLSDKPQLTAWCCFHCGFETSDYQEAEAHFGERDDPEEFKPLCRWWKRMSSEERGQALQDTIQELAAEREENARMRTQVEGLEEALRAQREWIAVADRTPEIQPGTRHTWVLVFTGQQIAEGRYCKTFNPGVYLWLDVRGHSISVTHWMPLPDPPEVSPK